MESRKPGSKFFKINTGLDFAKEIANIVLEPFFPLTFSPAAILVSGYKILCAIKELFCGEPDKVKTEILEAVGLLIMSPICLITALLSPLLNLIDILGSAIKKLLPENADQASGSGFNSFNAK